MDYLHKFQIENQPNLSEKVVPYWTQLIYELVKGAGYSYSRIAHRIGVSPSTIQKLATHINRKPRHIIFHRLLVLYHKVFYGPNPAPNALAYIKQKEKARQKELEALTMYIEQLRDKENNKKTIS